MKVDLNTVLFEVARRFGDRMTAEEFSAFRRALGHAGADDDPIIFPVRPVEDVEAGLDQVVRDSLSPFAGKDVFTDAQRFTIVHRLALGEQVSALATEYGVSRDIVARLVRCGVFELRRAARPYRVPAPHLRKRDRRRDGDVV